MRGPVAEGERIETLDVLRGFAVLGILIMNIQAFANLDTAYANPTLAGPFKGADYWIWYLSHLLAEMKFMTIFSALFGAGVVLMTSRREQAGEKSRGLHYRRMLFLLLFGLVHGILMWWGDILVWYALTGMWIYLFRRRRPRTLIIWGVVFVALTSAISIFTGWSIQFWPPERVNELIVEGWAPPIEKLQENLHVYRNGTWAEQVAYRAPKIGLMNTFLYLVFGAWRTGGVMLLGMAFFKLGVLSGQRSRRFYLAMVVLGILGLPVVGYGVYQQAAHGWSGEYTLFYGTQYNYWASLLVAGGWIGAVMLVCRSGRLAGLVEGLAAVGRMAFSNYIAQTVIGTAIFYSWGLGLYGSVDRIGQVLIVVAVFALQIAVSPVWLQYFRFGPLEWLWRTLSYGRLQPMLAERRARGAPGVVGP
jgi:uncharacterized protein